MTTKTFALTLALLPALAGARDLRPGTIEVGAGTALDLGTATTEVGGREVDVSTVSVDADALFYVASNLGLGFGVSYERTETEVGLVSSESTTSLIGPQVKLSLPIAPRASLLFAGLVGVQTVTDEDTGLDADGYAFGLGGGIRFFAADFVSLDAMLEYASGSVEDDASGTEIDVSGWGLGVGFSLYFGGR